MYEGSTFGMSAITTTQVFLEAFFKLFRNLMLIHQDFIHCRFTFGQEFPTDVYVLLRKERALK